jgi:hypothetical protein
MRVSGLGSFCNKIPQVDVEAGWVRFAKTGGSHGRTRARAGTEPVFPVVFVFE